MGEGGDLLDVIEKLVRSNALSHGMVQIALSLKIVF